MGVKPAAFFAAALAASAAAQAEDILNPQLTTPGTMLYVSIPLGATTARERAPSYGLALQGRRQYETVTVDSRMFTFVEGAIAGIEVKWLLAGAVAVGAGAYAVNRDKKRSDGYSGSQNQQQQQQQQQQNSPPPPACDPDPCKK